MRSYKAVINEAKLLTSIASDVVRFLEERAVKITSGVYGDEYADEELEFALLARNDPLITITLARCGWYPKVIKEIFRDAFISEYSKAISYSVLSNEVLGASFKQLPKCLFATDDDLVYFVANADIDVLLVLFKNPTINDNFLCGVLEGDKYWQAMDEKRRMHVVGALSNNKRIATPWNEENYIDGYAEYKYGKIFDAIWKLSEALPVTDQWAEVLSWLYDKALPETSSVENPLEIAKRWFSQDDKINNKEKIDNAIGLLSNYQMVRKGLAVIYINRSGANIEEILDDVDVAVRAAAYRFARITIAQINSAYETDNLLFFQEAISNDKIWMEAKVRGALRNIAWAIDEKVSSFDAINLYSALEERMKRIHPAWFVDENEGCLPEVDKGELPVTKNDLENATTLITDKLRDQKEQLISLIDQKYNDYQSDIDDGALPVTKNELEQAKEFIVTNSLGQTEQVLSQVNKTIVKIKSHVDWIWWFSLGALAATLYKH